MEGRSRGIWSVQDAVQSVRQMEQARCFQQDLHRVGKPVSHDCSCRFPLPEEQSVHQLSGPCPHPVPRPTVTARGQGFVRPAAEERIDELVNGDQRSFSVGHAASTSSGVVAASTAALRSPPRCIVPFLCRMAPPA